MGALVVTSPTLEATPGPTSGSAELSTGGAPLNEQSAARPLLDL
jgi:hypothetical protein